jgi:hypothetical protein
MNLGKLLGAGKSFVNGGKVAAYRANKHAYLPKFTSPKNPFAAVGQAELPAPPIKNSVQPMEKVTLPAFMTTQKMPPISATPKSLAAWTSRLNPLTLLRGAPAETNDLERAVQAELSLEKIKVVHNDLTDAEVEVVPVKSRPAAPTMPLAEKSWEVLGERIFGTNPT